MGCSLPGGGRIVRRNGFRALGFALAVAAFVAVVWSVVAHRRAEAWFDADRDVWFALSEGVSQALLARGGDAGVSTGSERFDGEWDLVTCQMGVIGLAQVALVYPDAEPRFRDARDRCLEWMVTPEARAFGTRAWGSDALDEADGTHAYMGYVNLALGLDRLVRGSSPHAELHDRLTAQFTAGLAEPIRRFQTYPGETYPPDLSTVGASIAVHALASDRPVPDSLAEWSERFEAASVDPQTGWIRQSIDVNTGADRYGLRGSGTAFTAAWMAWVDPDLSQRLYTAHRDLGRRGFLGFGGMREYPPGVSGWGDIDSGPVLFGVGVSATGFALAGARVHGDRVTHRRLYRTAHLFGLPTGGGRWFATGGGIGNSLMLAMLTAPSRETLGEPGRARE